MNYLKNKVVYLSGPIHAVVDDGVGWRNTITPILEQRFNMVVCDPCKKNLGVGEIGDDKKYFKKLIKEKNFKQLKDDFYKIVRADLQFTDKSDLLIVVYDPTIHMFGTIHEMIVASTQKKPILVKYDKNQIDSMNPWLFTLIKDNWAFDEWEYMFQYLDTINSGKIDSSHWW